MTDKVLKCSSCGFPLDAVSGSQTRIKCPKCGAVNVIETDPDNKSASDDVVQRLPVTDNWSDVHKSIVDEIINNHENMPSDIFQELKIVSAERLIVPCYLFDCSVTFRPIQKINVDKQSYAVKTQQNDPYAYSVKMFRSGNSQYQDVVTSLYETNNLVDLVDIEKIQYPSDVIQKPADIPIDKAQDDIKQTIVSLSGKQAKTLVESGYYPNLSGSKHEFNINYSYESRQINLPLIHVTFTYKNQQGDFYLSGDAQRTISMNLPVGTPLNFRIKQISNDYQTKIASSGCGCAVLFWGGIAVIISLCLYYAKICSFYVPLTLILIGIPAVLWAIYQVIKGGDTIKQEQEDINKLRQDHARLFDHFVKKRHPLRGIWEDSLFGVPEAFPQNVRLNERQDVNSDEPQVHLVVHSIGDRKLEVMKIVYNATGLSLFETKNLVEKSSPFTISVPERQAFFIKKELEKAGATVTSLD